MRILDMSGSSGVDFEETTPGEVYRDVRGHLVMPVVADRKTVVFLAGPCKGKQSGSRHGPFVPVDATLVIGEVPA